MGTRKESFSSLYDFSDFLFDQIMQYRSMQDSKVEKMRSKALQAEITTIRIFFSYCDHLKRISRLKTQFAYAKKRLYEINPAMAKGYFEHK